MISGVVNADLEALIRLTIQGPDGIVQEVEAVIDTGFSGFLTLPPSVITALGLPWLCCQVGELADGELHEFNVHAAIVTWDGLQRVVETEAVMTQPLVGMRMLRGQELRIRVEPGDSVSITDFS